MPVDNDSLAEIQVILRERDVFTSGYDHVGVDLYEEEVLRPVNTI